jgi:hypothetical protein
MVQWLRPATANPEVLDFNPGFSVENITNFSDFLLVEEDDEVRYSYAIKEKDGFERNKFGVIVIVRVNEADN